MKRIVILTMILATVALGMSSCKKYDDDAKRSWSSPKSRLIGTWNVEADKGAVGPHAAGKTTFTFEKDGKGVMATSFKIKEVEMANTYNFKWEFGEKKNSLIVEVEHKADAHGHGAEAGKAHSHKDEYKILQLTKKNLWIESEKEIMGKKNKVVMKLVKA